MKKYLLPASFFLCALSLPAQEVLGTGGTIVTEIADALHIQHHINDIQSNLQGFIDRAQQITSAMNTLMTLNQSLQYQIMAAESLAEGSWEGFVDFFNYQAGAISGFTSSILNVNEITDAFSKYDPETGQFEHAFDSAGYEQLKQHAVNLNRSMLAANDMVRSSDSLLKQTERNVMVVQQGVMAAANAPNALQALQGQAKILSAIASESASATQLMYSQQRFLQTLVQNMQETNALNAALIDNAVKFDPSNNPYETPEHIRQNIRRSLAGEYLGVDVPNWP
jgi:hypothetical protein